MRRTSGFWPEQGKTIGDLTSSIFCFLVNGGAIALLIALLGMSDGDRDNELLEVRGIWNCENEVVRKRWRKRGGRALNEATFPPDSF